MKRETQRKVRCMRRRRRKEGRKEGDSRHTVTITEYRIQNTDLQAGSTQRVRQEQQLIRQEQVARQAGRHRAVWPEGNDG